MIKKTIITLSLILTLVSCSSNEIENNKSEEVTEKKYKILALWDSLTAWYNLDISESYPYQLEELLNKNKTQYEVINAWVSWDTSKNLISRLNLYTESYDIVLLNIGWNDWLRSLSLNDLKSNIITTIEKFPDSKVVLFTIDLPGNYWFLYRNKLKKVYENILEKREIYNYWLFFEGLDYKKHFLDDGLHPNWEWYSIISENIYDYLLKNNLIKND